MLAAKALARLEGGGGRDMLYGRGGSDTLIGGLDGEADVIDGGADTDTVDYSAGRLGMTITLGNGPTKLGNGTPGSAVVDDHVEYFDVFGGRTLSMRREGWQEDELYSIENVIGSQGNDTITGNGVGNRLEGGNGDDVIDGGGGADTIIGGRGADELTGGPGADTFVFLDVSDSDGATGGLDFIWDFIPGEDKIDVSAIDADTTRSGNQRFTVVEDFTGHAGELTMFFFTNPNNANIANRWIVSGDVNGDGAWDIQFDMWPAALSDVTAADFIL
jgi:serralysin